MGIFEVFLLSLIEGLTEFLPVSSTGHLILTSALLGIQDEGFVKSFNIIIQFGAIASVLVLYWRRFLPNREFYTKLVIAFLPAAIIGLLVKSKINAILGSVHIVAGALVVGGAILILSDRVFSGEGKGRTIKDLSYRECFLLGVSQCFAFIPGVSRSAASILGGLGLGLSRKEAAEFSFFLAVPTLGGATVLKAKDIIPTLDANHWGLLLLGIFLSFVFALLAIRFFIGIVSRFGFRHFGIYRIILGGLILIFI